MSSKLTKIKRFDLPYCREQGVYKKTGKIGQGTFGEVFKARDKKTRRMVALKKILMENEREGFPITALREIRILQVLKHENIVSLIEICRSTATEFNRATSTFYLVFEFCDHDLAGLLRNEKVTFSLGEIKKVMQQIFDGLHFIHSSNIMHRDLKPANILITKNGVLKLADFGLARARSSMVKNKPTCYTNVVVTLWYRSPELLLGDHNYGPPIDMWAAGCIMAEMWWRTPIMKGSAEQHQLTLISKLCGSIGPEIWPQVTELKLYKTLVLQKGQKRKVKEFFKSYVQDQWALDLLDRLLCLDPTHRVDAESSLMHDTFYMDPKPCDLSKMLSEHSTSMFDFLATGPLRKRVAKPKPQPQPQPQQRPLQTTDQHFDRVF